MHFLFLENGKFIFLSFLEESFTHSRERIIHSYKKNILCISFLEKRILYVR